MANQIFEEFGKDYDVQLIPSSGGVHEIIVDGNLVYSKKETGEHPDYEKDIAPHLRS